MAERPVHSQCPRTTGTLSFHQTRNLTNRRLSTFFNKQIGPWHLAWVVALFGTLVMWPVDSHAQSLGNLHAPLLGLARLPEGVETRRVSSYNQTGANRDRIIIPKGESATIFDVEGAGIVTHIWMTIAPRPVPRNDIILRMWWDGEEEPSVEAPLGPFFGQGWEASYLFKSLPLAAAPTDGRSLVSYFSMPFSESARITVENDTGRRMALYYYVDYLEVDDLPDNMGRFHAQYRHELTEAMEGSARSIKDPIEGSAHKLSNEQNTTGAGNYLVADIEGRGRFIGVNFYIHSPTPAWYGEGDEMIFIDGKAWPPRLHGTGTEDYFNTAFGPSAKYQHPFFGLIPVSTSFDHLGRWHYYRFHITDPIYFDESLVFSIEHGHNNNLTLDIRSVAYWYQTEPHKPFPPLPTAEEREPMPRIEALDVQHWRQVWRRHSGANPYMWGDEWEQQNE